VSNFNEYMNMLEICTDITGRKDLFAQNGTEVQRQVDEARALVNQRNLEGKKAPTIVFLRASASSIKAKGSYGNVGGEMLADLGCINIADDDNSLLDDLSMEAIIAADPDYIFVTTQGTDGDAVQQNIEETLLNNPAWNKLTAVKNGKYFVLEKELYNLKPNARWGEAYQKLADILYGEGTVE
ncbi:MAG: ABC transporter substrate-binding protein, partial [Lachnospiraceae bacterium]|nr:ABC transporter substrate-binding protein [Lachnospiraceae bacterium]